MVAIASKPTDGDVIDQFLAAMREKNIDVDEPIIADGKLHRYHATGDRHHTRNAWAILHIDDRPAGQFGCNKRYGHGVKFPWKMNGVSELTEDQRRELKRIARERREKREEEEKIASAKAATRARKIYDAARPVDLHPYLKAKGVQSNPRLRVADWRWLDEETGETGLIASDALIVPIWDFSQEMHSLQVIYFDTKSNQFEKRYLKNGEKGGYFLALGPPVDDTIYICEGLATGLSIAQCTGQCVVVAFDSGNLLAVGKTVIETAKKFEKNWRIVFCADNDAWTDKPIKNPGLHYARKAVAGAGGTMVYPEFKNTESKPKDFNDLHQLEGEEAVRKIVLAKPPDLPPGVPPAGGDDDGMPSDEAIPFETYGYDHDGYYFKRLDGGIVKRYTASQLATDAILIELGPVNFWQSYFQAANNAGYDKKGIQQALQDMARKHGMFSPNKIRGRGAWEDDGRNIFHLGEYLIIDGQMIDFKGIFESKFTYERRENLLMPADKPTTDVEGFAILNLASQFPWTMQGSAALLVGWIVNSIVCGTLPWRPHIWLAGNAGSGKSTVMESFINVLLRDIVLFAQGNSTEAGIRQTLKSDALPVIIDETEQNEDREIQRMQSILALARQASTNNSAKTFKGAQDGNAINYHIRSMFCFSSIQVGVKHQADIGRISILAMKPADKGPRSAERWELMRDELHKLNQPDISARLFRRTLDLLSTLLKNIEVFKSTAARIFSNQRIADQYGTLLAGCFALISRKEATPEDAATLINSYSWTEHVTESDGDESQRALQGLLDSPIRVNGSDFSVFELMKAAQNMTTLGADNLEQDKAIAVLGRHGLKISGDFLLLSNTSNELRGLMENTTFKADWKGVLQRLPGADRNDNVPVRMNGVMVKVTRINMESIFAGEPRKVTQADIDDDPPAPF